jgi:hypothetical protein
MEFLAYAIGFQVYLVLKRKFRDVIAPAERWQVIAAAVFGAALGRNSYQGTPSGVVMCFLQNENHGASYRTHLRSVERDGHAKPQTEDYRSNAACIRPGVASM